MPSFFSKLFGGRDASRDLAEVEQLAADLKAGALYSVYNGEESSTYGVVKLLVVEPGVVHIRVYANTFPARPTEVEPESLHPGSLLPGDLESDEKLDAKVQTASFGIGHMPIAMRDFVYGWQPVFLAESPVTDEELEGYQSWKREGGGVFGGL